MTSLEIQTFIGDSIDFTIPMVWGGAAFDPGVDWGAIWTCKQLGSELDPQALIQKRSGAGIVFSGTNAIVSFVPDDTYDLKPGATDPVWDLQLQNLATGAVRTVAFGTLNLLRDVTRGTEPVIPIYTTDPASPWPSLGTSIHGAAAKNTLADNDEFGIADSQDSYASKKITWTNILAALSTYFNTVFARLDTANSWAQPQTFGVTKYSAAMFVVDNSTLRILSAADHGLTIIFTNPAAIAVTLNSGLPSWFFCTPVQVGLGVVTIGGTAVRQCVAGFAAKTSGQYSQISIANYGVADTYLIGGALGV